MKLLRSPAVRLLLFPAATGLILFGSASPAAGEPAFQPGELWRDEAGVPINVHGGGVLHHEGTYYWFGEHKVAGVAGNSAQVGVRVDASADLYNWKNAGVALPVSDDPTNDLAKGCILERPNVIFNAATGKFVMWFHLEPKGAGYHGAASGVAVADQVTGPYRFLGSLRPNAGVWPLNVPAQLRTPLSPVESALIVKLALNGGPVREGFSRRFQ